MTVVDCFGGVSLGAHDAALMRVRHVSVELESRFHDLAKANVELWQRRYGHLPQWARPMCLQGDSRFLAQVLEKADCCISSPPYSSEGLGHCKASHASNDRGRMHIIANAAKLSKSDL